MKYLRCFDFAVIIAGNVLTMKPVHYCTGFIFCTLPAAIYMYI